MGLNAIRSFQVIPTPSPPVMAKVPFSIQAQEETLWCWVAVAQLVVRAKNGYKDQCRLATEHFQYRGKPYVCCPNDPKFMRNACNQIEDLRPALESQSCLVTETQLGAAGLSRQSVEDLLRKELQSNRPVGLLLEYNGAKHYIAITGIDQTNPATWLEIQDPDGGRVLFIRISQLLHDKVQYAKWLAATHLYAAR